MNVALFSTKPYDRTSFQAANAQLGHEMVHFGPRLTAQTCPLAAGFPVVCDFVSDTLDAHVLLSLMKHGIRLVALRCAGFNHVDLGVADHLGLTVPRLPADSPHAVAEHTLALILALDRKIHMRAIFSLKISPTA
jgi:D-lactate dehydrogenase